MLTGPLPERVDHRKLARDRTRLLGQISLGQMSRFTALLLSDRGEASIELQFGMGKGRTTRIDGEVSADVKVTCQYCLEAMEIPVAATINLLIVDSTEALLALPQGQDGLVCQTEQLDLVEVVEDELIVGLPMVTRHEKGECLNISEYQDDSRQGDTWRPFEALKKLKDD